eukprot:366024-Chlamydomonas_euryale.AAC.9
MSCNLQASTSVLQRQGASTLQHRGAQAHKRRDSAAACQDLSATTGVRRDAAAQAPSDCRIMRASVMWLASIRALHVPCQHQSAAHACQHRSAARAMPASERCTCVPHRSAARAMSAASERCMCHASIGALHMRASIGTPHVPCQRLSAAHACHIGALHVPCRQHRSAACAMPASERCTCVPASERSTCHASIGALHMRATSERCTCHIGALHVPCK